MAWMLDRWKCAIAPSIHGPWLVSWILILDCSHRLSRRTEAADPSWATQSCAIRCADLDDSCFWLAWRHRLAYKGNTTLNQYVLAHVGSPLAVLPRPRDRSEGAQIAGQSIALPMAFCGSRRGSRRPRLFGKEPALNIDEVAHKQLDILLNTNVAHSLRLGARSCGDPPVCLSWLSAMFPYRRRSISKRMRSAR